MRIKQERCKKADDGTADDIRQKHHKLQIFISRNFDKKEIRQKILEGCDDEPHAQQIFQVVFQRIEKCGRKTVIVKNPDKIFKAYKICLSHAGIIGKSQIYHINNRNDRKYGIDHSR